MRIMHWNFFKETDNQSGAKRYEDELFNNMTNVERIRRNKGNVLLDVNNFKSHNADVVHATFQALAPLKLINRPERFILTVHDIIPKIYYSKTQKVRHMWYLIEYAIPRADKIVVYSEFNKDELINKLNVKEEKIHVVPLGINESYKLLDKNKCKKRFNLDPNTKHILVVSSNAPWKNIGLVSEIADILTDYKIVKIGYGEMLENSNVLNLGYVEEEDMPLLYNACDLFLQTSLNEGGLPALESMACGCPVLSADAASLREIVSYGGILLNAGTKDSKYEFHSWICSILEEEHLSDSLIESGLKRAREFSWSRTANETMEVYENA